MMHLSTRRNTIAQRPRKEMNFKNASRIIERRHEKMRKGEIKRKGRYGYRKNLGTRKS